MARPAVLLVDDDPLNVDLFVSVLQGEDIDIVVETNGLDAEARAVSRGFDLLLLDIKLPGQSGIDLCRRLRAAGMRAPIIAMSASMLPAEIEAALQVGFDRFVGKPVSPAELRSLVREFTHPARSC
jgi:CheY-like chemotaxis protein